MPTNEVRETAAEFLGERQDFLHVFVVRSPGDGWDVVVRVDGTYSDPKMAARAAEGMKARIDLLGDARKDDRKWWLGPPWKKVHQHQPKGETL